MAEREQAVYKEAKKFTDNNERSITVKENASKVTRVHRSWLTFLLTQYGPGFHGLIRPKWANMV